MSKVAVSALAEVNPPARIPKGVTGGSPVSFIPMSDVSESGQWTVRQSRLLRSITVGLTAFEEGDVLIAKITPCLENGKGAHAAGLENGIGFGSTEFHVLRARAGYEPRFLFHLSQWRRFRRAAEGQMVGSAGQQRVPRTFFDEFQVDDFATGEQTQIAQILDTLDTAIHETEAIIAKLKAVKQGLMHDLLTRGIDANGEPRPPQAEAPHLYKESALGWIPKEWEIESVAKACSDVVDCPHSTPNFEDQGVLVARTMNIKDGLFLDGLASRVSERQYRERIARLEPQAGDVIFTREAPVGEAFVIPSGMKICLGQRVMLLRPKDRRMIGEYLLAQIYSGTVKDRIAALTSGTTNPHLNVAEVKDFEIPLPPFVEQQGIAERLRGLESRLQSEARDQQKLELLKSGLMDDLLTGRVRVTPLLDATSVA
jgi:type I restriction enzyme S subunit